MVYIWIHSDMTFLSLVGKIFAWELFSTFHNLTVSCDNSLKTGCAMTGKPIANWAAFTHSVHLTTYSKCEEGSYSRTTRQCCHHKDLVLLISSSFTCDSPLITRICILSVVEVLSVKIFGTCNLPYDFMDIWTPTRWIKEKWWNKKDILFEINMWTES